MQVVKLQEPYDNNLIPEGPIVLCLGFFDGVHRGHQAVIREGKRRAEKLGAKLAIMTLDRYPGIVFNNEANKDFAYLSSERKKLELFERFGVDLCYVVSFDEKFYTLSQQDFVEKYIVSLHAVCAVAGSDYTYGKMPYANGGDMLDDGEKISSTRIRKALRKGNVKMAADLLGYSYETSGQVVHGFERGRKLGFPTLNLETKEPVMIPAEGVYAVFVRFEGEEKRYMGMASIGRNETFGNHFEKTIEINLLDFSDMVYGKNVFVEWIEFLRGMKKFSGAKDLIEQLNHDKERTRKILEKRN